MARIGTHPSIADLDHYYAPPRSSLHRPPPRPGLLDRLLTRKYLGYSGIEWIVVASIIALLAAQLIPATRQARCRSSRPATRTSKPAVRAGSAWRPAAGWARIR